MATGQVLWTCDCGNPHPAAERVWRNVPCQVGEHLYVCGDLPWHDADAARRVLAAWESLGIEVVVDLRTEGTDWPRPSPVTHVRIPTLDDGRPRPGRLFDRVVALVDGRSALIHCHMGVARGPSAAFAVLLARGVHELRAIETVLTARPIADAAYAADALAWHLGDTPELAVRRRQLDERRQQLVADGRGRLLAGLEHRPTAPSRHQPLDSPRR